MYPVHDMFPFTLPQYATAEANLPATAKLSGREADWAQAGQSGRSGRRFALSV